MRLDGGLRPPADILELQAMLDARTRERVERMRAAGDPRILEQDKLRSIWEGQERLRRKARLHATPFIATLYHRVAVASRGPRSRRASSSPRRARAPASSSSSNDDDPAGPERAAFTRLFLDALVRDDPIWALLRVEARSRWECAP